MVKPKEQTHPLPFSPSVPPTLPPFATALPDQAVFDGVGINAAGQLYLYGDDPKAPGLVIPGVTGRPVQLVVRMLGARGRYGARPYLELYLGPEQPPDAGAVLRIPAARVSAASFTPTGAARSLLPALAALPPQTDIITVVSKRGDEASFLNIFPRDSAGRPLAQIRVKPLSLELGAMDSAIAAVCARLQCQTIDFLALLSAPK